MSKKYVVTDKGTYYLVKNKGGKTLSYSKTSGVKLIEVDGFAFKDLAKTGKLEPYCDWRLPYEERINDLVKRLSIEEIAGLMLYSKHQSLSSQNDFTAMWRGLFNGKKFEESGCKIWELSDQQKDFVMKNNIRHFLITKVDDPQTAAKWNNNIQSLSESLGFGIPCNNCSDPRNSPHADAEFNAGAGGQISLWPEPIGIAATFDPEISRSFGDVASTEYRAMGICSTISPQIDLCTDARWNRLSGCFSPDPKLSTDLAVGYCDGFQTTKENRGWGDVSVNTMCKHWPGGGCGEGGRDAHFGMGKFAVYPGNCFEEHLKPFLDGAFKLKGGTGMTSAIMPYYTIAYGIDKKYGENVGNCYSKYIIQDLLRDKHGYDDVVVTDWNVTLECNDELDNFFVGKGWGVENLSLAEKHYKIIMAGCDQFGGNSDCAPIIEAYNMGVKEHGEEFMKKRFEATAKRVLRNMFRVGLFENPYTDPDYAQKIVGSPEFRKIGYEAQLKSIVMVKNRKGVIPIKSKQKRVYIPDRRPDAGHDYFGLPTKAGVITPEGKAVASKYFTVVEKPEEADFAIVFIESPNSFGYINGEFVPLTLQYGEYTATAAREHSIAMENGVDRSYKGKKSIAANHADLDIILETRAKMRGKPIIVSIYSKNPTIVKEFEKEVDAILVEFGVEGTCVLDIISGRAEPSGLLPFQMPADMETVEKSCEDKPNDYKCHVDEEGNKYDFGFGLNYKGVINDARTKKYKLKA